MVAVAGADSEIVAGAVSAPAPVSADGRWRASLPPQPASAPGAATLSLSVNGQQFASRSSAFTYRAAGSVSSLWPAVGASEGGTPLTVLGSGFSSAAEAMGALRCRFNASDVPAAHVSESALVCNTTGFAASGEASVEVVVEVVRLSYRAITDEYTAGTAIAPNAPRINVLGLGAIHSWGGPVPSHFSSGCSLFSLFLLVLFLLFSLFSFFFVLFISFSLFCSCRAGVVVLGLVFVVSSSSPVRLCLVSSST